MVCGEESLTIRSTSSFLAFPSKRRQGLDPRELPGWLIALSSSMQIFPGTFSYSFPSKGSSDLTHLNALQLMKSLQDSLAEEELGGYSDLEHLPNSP